MLVSFCARGDDGEALDCHLPHRHSELGRQAVDGLSIRMVGK